MPSDQRKSTGTKRGEVGAPREVPHAKQRAISEFDLREPRKWQMDAFCAENPLDGPSIPTAKQKERFRSHLVGALPRNSKGDIVMRDASSMSTLNERTRSTIATEASMISVKPPPRSFRKGLPPRKSNIFAQDAESPPRSEAGSSPDISDDDTPLQIKYCLPSDPLRKLRQRKFNEPEDDACYPCDGSDVVSNEALKGDCSTADGDRKKKVRVNKYNHLDGVLPPAQDGDEARCSYYFRDDNKKIVHREFPMKSKFFLFKKGQEACISIHAQCRNCDEYIRPNMSGSNQHGNVSKKISTTLRNMKNHAESCGGGCDGKWEYYFDEDQAAELLDKYQKKIRGELTAGSEGQEEMECPLEVRWFYIIGSDEFGSGADIDGQPDLTYNKDDDRRCSIFFGSERDDKRYGGWLSNYYDEEGTPSASSIIRMPGVELRGKKKFIDARSGISRTLGISRFEADPELAKLFAKAGLPKIGHNLNINNLNISDLLIYGHLVASKLEAAARVPSSPVNPKVYMTIDWKRCKFHWFLSNPMPDPTKVLRAPLMFPMLHPEACTKKWIHRTFEFEKDPSIPNIHITAGPLPRRLRYEGWTEQTQDAKCAASMVRNPNRTFPNDALRLVDGNRVRINLQKPKPKTVAFDENVHCHEATLKQAREQEICGVHDPWRGVNSIAPDMMQAITNPEVKSILILGNSGSGKTSLLRCLAKHFNYNDSLYPCLEWDENAVCEKFDCKTRDRKGNSLTELEFLANVVGLNSVPTRLKPHRVLSSGEQYRVDLMALFQRVASDGVLLVDEYTSHLERDLACNVSSTVSKYIAREMIPGSKVILASCNNDIQEPLQPDLVILCEERKEPVIVPFEKRKERLIQRSICLSDIEPVKKTALHKFVGRFIDCQYTGDKIDECYLDIHFPCISKTTKKDATASGITAQGFSEVALNQLILEGCVDNKKWRGAKAVRFIANAEGDALNALTTLHNAASKFCPEGTMTITVTEDQANVLVVRQNIGKQGEIRKTFYRVPYVMSPNIYGFSKCPKSPMNNYDPKVLKIAELRRHLWYLPQGVFDGQYCGMKVNCIMAFESRRFVQDVRKQCPETAHGRDFLAVEVPLLERTHEAALPLDADFCGMSFFQMPPIVLPKRYIGVLCGPSGSGKTSYINLNITQCERQIQWKVSHTIIEHFPKLDRAVECLEAANLERDCWAKKFDQLSMGQQSRAHIARQLENAVSNCRCKQCTDKTATLVFDDYTCVLDRETACEVSANIKKFLLKNHEKIPRCLFAGVHSDYFPYLQPEFIYDMQNQFLYDISMPDGREFLKQYASQLNVDKHGRSIEGKKWGFANCYYFNAVSKHFKFVRHRAPMNIANLPVNFHEAMPGQRVLMDVPRDEKIDTLTQFVNGNDTAEADPPAPERAVAEIVDEEGGENSIRMVRAQFLDENNKPTGLKKWFMKEEWQSMHAKLAPFDTPPLVVQRCLPSEWRSFCAHHYKTEALHTSVVAFVGTIDGIPVGYSAYLITGFQPYSRSTVICSKMNDTYPQCAFRNSQVHREHRTVIHPSYQSRGLGPLLADTVAYALQQLGYTVDSKTVHPTYASYRDAGGASGNYWINTKGDNVEDAKDGSDAEAESDDEAYEQHDNNNNKLSAQLDLPAAVNLDIVDDKIEREKTEDIMFLEPDDVEAIELALQETDQSATVDPFGTAPPSLKRRAVPNRRFESESVSPSKRVDKRKGARSIKSPRVKKEMKPRMKLEVKSEQDRTGPVEYHRDSDGEVEMEVAVRKKKSSNFKNGFRINVPKAAGARFWPPWQFSDQEGGAEGEQVQRPVETLKSHVWVGLEKRNVERNYQFKEARRALNAKIFVRNRVTEYDNNSISKDQFDKCMTVFERLASQKAGGRLRSKSLDRD